MSEIESEFMPTRRFSLAFELACGLHAEQQKKTGAPFISHLLEVSGYVLRAGGNEDQAIAALLHDSVEKSGGVATLLTIDRLFGEHVGKMVEDCTDSFDGEKKPKWRAVKEAQLERFLGDALPESCLVYASDKLSNGREILRRIRSGEQDVWSNYGGGRDGHLWYFRAMYDAFLKRGGMNPLMPELDECLRDLEATQ